MMNTKTYQGLLSTHSWGEATDILYLSSLADPFAQELEWMHRKNVTVRYWITDAPCTKDEAIVAAVLSLLGFAQIELYSRYSEMTGYLWTDEKLNVGGHDLLAELKSNAGKWLTLEIETSP